MKVAVDTSILLLHAFHVFEKGRFLPRVAPGNIDRRELPKILLWLDRLLTSSNLVTTTQVLTEFKHLLEMRAKLGDDKRKELLAFYGEFLSRLEEEAVNVKDVLLFEFEKKAWWLCFTDTSLVIASQRTDATLLTTDWPLYRWCSEKGMEARHIVEFYYGFR